MEKGGEKVEKGMSNNIVIRGYVSFVTSQLQSCVTIETIQCLFMYKLTYLPILATLLGFIRVLLHGCSPVVDWLVQ